MRRRRLLVRTTTSLADLLPLILLLRLATAASPVAAVNAEPAPAAVVDVDDLLASVRAAAAASAGSSPLSPAAAATAGRTAMGNACGPGIGRCSLAGEGGGGCCSERGMCGFQCSAGLCQPEFSFPGFCDAGRRWNEPPSAPSLPVARPGSPCGPFVARCGGGSCCGSLGFCVASPSPLCGGEAEGEEERARTTRRFRVVATRGDVDALGGWNSSSSSSDDNLLRRPGGVLVNGRGSPSSPSPLSLDAEVGDVVVVEFVNALEVATSLHFHGVRWRDRSHEDGVAGVTQRAVAAGDTEGPLPAPPAFVYDFVAREPGTFWWHAHVRALAADGLRGSLVVRGRDGEGRGRRRQPEATLFVADFYGTGADDTLSAYLSDANAGGKEPTPDALTINGRSWWWETRGDGGGGSGSGGGVAPPSSPPPTVRVASRSDPSPPLARCSEPRERRALVRLVNGGIFATVAVHFEAASATATGALPPRIRATVVAADAVPTVPTIVNRGGRPLRLGVGQRHDVELCVEGDGDASSSSRSPPSPSSVRLVWAVAVADGALFDAPMRVSNVTAALLRFGGGDGGEDVSLVAAPTGRLNLSDAGVRALAPPALSSDPSTSRPPSPLPTITHDLAITFGTNGGKGGGGGGGGPSYFVSGVSQRPKGLDDPRRPSFLEREVSRGGGGGGGGERGGEGGGERGGEGGGERGGEGGEEEGDGHENFHVLRHSLGDVVEMRLRNDDDVDHAWHLHGHNFWVVGTGEEEKRGATTATTTAEIAEARDVVLVPRRSTVVARYVADSPGAFLAHCHQGWHHEAGLGVLMADGIGEGG